MPSKSPEAIARKNAKKRAARAAQRAASVECIPDFISKTHPTYRRRLPPVPDMIEKSELRAFLAQAVRNTGASA